MPKNCSVPTIPAALALMAIALPLALPNAARAQSLLTLDEALRIAADSNRAVRLAANDARIARNNVTAGNAGFLPKLDVTAGAAGNLTNARQELTTGEIQQRIGAAGSTINSGIGVTWTVFDGFAMFHRRDELKLERELGELGVETSREQVSAQVMRAYYDVVVQQRALAVLADAVATSEDRLKNVQLKYEVGENSKRELLPAKVDLNADRSALLRQQVALENSKTTLNTLLARDPATRFVVTDTIVLANDLAYDALLAEARANNRRLREAQLGVSLAKIDREQVESARYPKVGLTLGYNLTQSANQSATIATNRNMGLTYGLTASMNLFDGFNTNREAENAELRITSSALELSEAEQQMEGDLLKAYTNYRNRLEVVALERQNVTLARENLDLTMERYKVGAIIPLELREAQNAYIAAEGRLLSAEYEAKLAETELLRLSGRLGI